MNAVTPHAPQACNDGAARKWIAELGALCYPHDPALGTRALLVYLPPLMADFPGAVWCQRSLFAVAQAKRRMAIPGYDEVHAALSAWWREHRPHPVALPEPREPDRVPPTQAEIDAVTRTLTAHRAELAERQQALQADERRMTNRPVRTIQDDRALVAGLRRQLADPGYPAELKPFVAARLRTLTEALGLREVEHA